MSENVIYVILHSCESVAGWHFGTLDYPMPLDLSDISSIYQLLNTVSDAAERSTNTTLVASVASSFIDIGDGILIKIQLASRPARFKDERWSISSPARLTKSRFGMQRRCGCEPGGGFRGRISNLISFAALRECIFIRWPEPGRRRAVLARGPLSQRESTLAVNRRGGVAECTFTVFTDC